MSADAPLAVAVDGDCVVISIGTGALLAAVRATDWWAGADREIIDPAAFLDVIVEQLRRDNFEDGQPLAFVAFSMAAEEAADGEDCPGLRFTDEDPR